jgi:hypothetical protein
MTDIGRWGVAGPEAIAARFAGRDDDGLRRLYPCRGILSDSEVNGDRSADEVISRFAREAAAGRQLVSGLGRFGPCLAPCPFVPKLHLMARRLCSAPT